jgi:sulfite reductase (NADPH) flavoprotein alpha-component
MISGISVERLVLAAAALALYGALCAATYLGQRRKRASALRSARSLTPAAAGAHSWLVAFASQTGNAEQIAWHTGRLLHTAGLPAEVVPLGKLGRERLRTIERALFVVSTYGEGDVPDAAARFARDLMAGEHALDKLRYGLLALGDAAYRNSCGLGRALDGWLQ